MDARKLFAHAVENWPVKVLSLVLAIILFVFHRMTTLETRSIFVPIAVEHLGGMMPASPYPLMIRVSLRGEAESIYSILEGDIEAFADMSAFNTPGSYLVPVEWRKKGTALEVEPLQISVEPAEITFSLDQKISKFASLIPHVTGQVEEGYNMTSLSLNPSRVIIDGPAELMGGISELHTEPIDLAGRSGDFFQTVNILRSDPLVIIRGDGTTQFSGTISRIIAVRNIADVPVTVTGLGEEWIGELETQTAGIHLEGVNQDEVNAFSPPPGFLSVDCSAITEEGEYDLPVSAGEAGNLTVRIEPETVRIQVSRAEGEDFDSRDRD